jgi:hypothetical protein
LIKIVRKRPAQPLLRVRAAAAPGLAAAELYQRVAPTLVQLDHSTTMYVLSDHPLKIELITNIEQILHGEGNELILRLCIIRQSLLDQQCPQTVQLRHHFDLT